MLLICHYLPYQSSWLLLPQYHRCIPSNCHIINNNNSHLNNHSNSYHSINGNQWHICTLTLSVWLCTYFWVLLISSPSLLCFTSPLLLCYYFPINIVAFIVSSKLTISTTLHWHRSSNLHWYATAWLVMQLQVRLVIASSKLTITSAPSSHFLIYDVYCTSIYIYIHPLFSYRTLIYHHIKCSYAHISSFSSWQSISSHLLLSRSAPCYEYQLPHIYYNALHFGISITPHIL